MVAGRTVALVWPEPGDRWEEASWCVRWPGRSGWDTPQNITIRSQQEAMRHAVAFLVHPDRYENDDALCGGAARSTGPEVRE